MMMMMMIVMMIVIVIVIIVMMMNIGRQTLSWVPLQRFIMNAIFLKTKMMLMLIMMLMMVSNPIKVAKAGQGSILYYRHLTNVQPAQVMRECWFENTLARLSALRIKKNLTEIQVL